MLVQIASCGSIRTIQRPHQPTSWTMHHDSSHLLSTQKSPMLSGVFWQQDSTFLQVSLWLMVNSLFPRTGMERLSPTNWLLMERALLNLMKSKRLLRPSWDWRLDQTDISTMLITVKMRSFESIHIPMKTVTVSAMESTTAPTLQTHCKRILTTIPWVMFAMMTMTTIRFSI